MFGAQNRGSGAGARRLDEEDEDCSQKGPKGCFRLVRLMPCRKIATAVAAGLCVLLVGGASRSLLRRTNRDSEPSPRIRGRHMKGEVLLSDETHYCSAPMEYPMPKRPTTEGGVALDLRLVQMTIRHGDRSAIHDLPNADPKKWQCQPFSEEIQQIWEGVSRFSVENVDGRPLERSFLPSVFTADELEAPFKGKKGLCKSGQLTEVGIRQHLTLGDRMRQAYHSLLGGDLREDEIYVRSTDYRRTLESAAAFLMSFFPGNSEMTIITDEDESEEVMHGIGLKHSSKGVTGGHEKTLVGACDRAIELSKTQNSNFKARSDVANGLASLFGEDMLAWKMTEAGDALHARSCHNMTLPCSSKGCVSKELALGVMSEADRQMCFRYVGAAGGAKATALALYPFTQELLTNMRRAMSRESPWKFALFSGHDTVVAPLLASLGAFDCRWPPYASYVAFELWTEPNGAAASADDGPRRRLQRRALQEERGREEEEDSESSHDPSTAEEEQEGGHQELSEAEAEAEGSGREEIEEDVDTGAYVRVTFNGRPVTRFIKDCQDLKGPYGSEFCPLSMLAKTIGRAIAPFQTLEKACEAHTNRHP
ncbi:unnamed protein product [Ascophyllum nodosum]